MNYFLMNGSTEVGYELLPVNWNNSEKKIKDFIRKDFMDKTCFLKI